MEGRNELLIRVYLVFFAFVLLAMIIISKVVKTALVEGEKWKAEGGKNIKLIDIEGERGNIYSEHGNLLATSLPYFDIKVDLLTSSDANFNKHILDLSLKLSQHFGSSPQHWENLLSKTRRDGKRGKNSNARYFSLLNKVTKEQLELLKTFPLFNLGRYKGGLLPERKTMRERPFKNLAERTIGKNRVNATNVGLEGSFNGVLKGGLEQRLMRRLPGDIWLPVQGPSEVVQDRGSDIVTTLDMHIQDIAHDELEQVLHANKAAKGVAIVMDVKTGGIKALVNLRANGKGAYVESYNDAVGTLSEPGSTFKLISSMVMMESGKVDLDTKVSMYGGKKKFYNLTMHDSEHHGTRSGTFKEAFAMSSNVGMGDTAFKIFGKNRDGWKAFYQGLKDLGVTTKTQIEINGERSPFVKDPSERKKDDPNNWSGTTVPWMAHGYELQMSPLQVLNIYNAVANDGKLMKPYLVTEMSKPDGENIKIRPQVLKQSIASPSTIMKAQELLKAVAESGTARGLKVDGLSFAGKTGTTRLEYWKESERKKYNASFAGYFPAENPKYSMIVVVYDPEGRDYYGARVAGPVFKNVMKRLSGYERRQEPRDVEEERKVVYAHYGHKASYKKVLDYMGYPYKSKGRGNWVEMESGDKKIMLNNKRISKSEVPDVRGKGLRDAVYILEALGMGVEVEGFGKVYKQSQKPGQEITNKNIKIYLK